MSKQAFIDPPFGQNERLFRVNKTIVSTKFIWIGVHLISNIIMLKGREKNTMHTYIQILSMTPEKRKVAIARPL